MPAWRAQRRRLPHGAAPAPGSCLAPAIAGGAGGEMEAAAGEDEAFASRVPEVRVDIGRTWCGDELDTFADFLAIAGFSLKFVGAGAGSAARPPAELIRV